MGGHAPLKGRSSDSQVPPSSRLEPAAPCCSLQEPSAADAARASPSPPGPSRKPSYSTSWPQLSPTGIRVPSGNCQYTCVYILNSKHQPAMLRTSGDARVRAAGYVGRWDPLDTHPYPAASVLCPFCLGPFRAVPSRLDKGRICSPRPSSGLSLVWVLSLRPFNVTYTGGPQGALQSSPSPLPASR